ncbi:MAG: exodeoxyribonuclease subunit gamma, partial [Ramlibacter sp.]|nr:exodeoxyribonuclease subunit gamma [Ramlibacter sp.]
LTVEHRLQPFHPAYFDGASPRLFSYADEWRATVIPAQPATQGIQDADAPLPPLPRNTPLTLRLLSQFLKDPVRSFFQLRLGIRFEDDDPVGQDQEPFALDALENWQLQHALIQAQKAAVDTGEPREPALRAQLERLAAQGELPLGHFSASARQALAEPMEKLFGEYAKVLAAWPSALPDAPLDFLPPGTDPSLRLEDWLDGLRGNGNGARARLVLESSGVVRDRNWRYDKLLPHWVAHLAGHLHGETLTTVVVSKAGTATLAPLSHDQALAHWDRLLDAWEQGLCLPLPFAVQAACAWLRKGDAEAARACYEDHDPDNMKFGERDRNAYLARAFADFEALWADGELAHWAEALLRPLVDALGVPARAKSDTEGAAA